MMNPEPWWLQPDGWMRIGEPKTEARRCGICKDAIDLGDHPRERFMCKTCAAKSPAPARHP